MVEKNYRNDSTVLLLASLPTAFKALVAVPENHKFSSAKFYETVIKDFFFLLNSQMLKNDVGETQTPAWPTPES